MRGYQERFGLTTAQDDALVSARRVGVNRPLLPETELLIVEVGVTASRSVAGAPQAVLSRPPPYLGPAAAQQALSPVCVSFLCHFLLPCPPVLLPLPRSALHLFPALLFPISFRLLRATLCAVGAGASRQWWATAAHPLASAMPSLVGVDSVPLPPSSVSLESVVYVLITPIGSCSHGGASKTQQVELETATAGTI